MSPSVSQDPTISELSGNDHREGEQDVEEVEDLVDALRLLDGAVCSRLDGRVGVGRECTLQPRGQGRGRFAVDVHERLYVTESEARELRDTLDTLLGDSSGVAVPVAANVPLHIF